MHWEKLLEKLYCYYGKLFIMNELGKVEHIFFSYKVIQWMDTVEWNNTKRQLKEHITSCWYWWLKSMDLKVSLNIILIQCECNINRDRE